MTPKAAGRKAKRLRDRALELDVQADAIIDEAAKELCPFAEGDMVFRRNDSNRRQYFFIYRVKGFLSDDEVRWVIGCCRCTRGKEKRGGLVWLKANSKLFPVADD